MEVKIFIDLILVWTLLSLFLINFTLFLQKVSCADSNVGDVKVRGISGGEKKRLSLACELIASPSVIFADEPTTGIAADFMIFKIKEFIYCTANF